MATGNPPATPLPLCRHFGECGGCQIQNLSYEAQLGLKRERLSALLQPFWDKEIVVHPSPDLYYYRNKMEYSFGRRRVRDPETGRWVSAETVLGFKMRGRWDNVLDIRECRLLSPEAPGLLESVRGWAAREGLEGYEPRNHAGFLRHLVVREGKRTGHRMVGLVACGDGDGGKGTQGGRLERSFLEAVLQSYPATTVFWGVHRGKSDIAVPDETKFLHGPGFIEEELRPDPLGRPLRFRISPTSFFQTNPLGAERLYGLLRDGLGREGTEVLLDLYGGCGGIAFSTADLVRKVVCVEASASAVEDARANAALNGISNVEFVCAKVEEALPELLAEWSGPSGRAAAVVLDPPRSGLHPKVREGLLGRGERLIYVSCNARALANDLKELVQCYKIERVEALDLFPHTDHVEVLVSLEPA